MKREPRCLGYGRAPGSDCRGPDAPHEKKPATLTGGRGTNFHLAKLQTEADSKFVASFSIIKRRLAVVTGEALV